MHYHKLKYSTIFIPIQWKYRLQYDKKVTLIFYIIIFLIFSLNNDVVFIQPAKLCFMLIYTKCSTWNK